MTDTLPSFSPMVSVVLPPDGSTFPPRLSSCLTDPAGSFPLVFYIPFSASSKENSVKVCPCSSPVGEYRFPFTLTLRKTALPILSAFSTWESADCASQPKFKSCTQGFLCRLQLSIAAVYVPDLLVSTTTVEPSPCVSSAETSFHFPPAGPISDLFLTYFKVPSPLFLPPRKLVKEPFC